MSPFLNDQSVRHHCRGPSIDALQAVLHPNPSPLWIGTYLRHTPSDFRGLLFPRQTPVYAADIFMLSPLHILNGHDGTQSIEPFDETILARLVYCLKYSKPYAIHQYPTLEVRRVIVVGPKAPIPSLSSECISTRGRRR